MIKLNNREKTIFAVCLLTVFVYICYSAFYLPLEDKRFDMQRKIDGAEKQLQREFEIIERSKNLGSEYEVLAEEFRQKGTEEEVMSEIINEIEMVSTEFGMQINQLKPQKKREVSFYNHFAVNLTIDGQLKEIVHFLHVLQQKPYLFSVDEAQFSRRLPRAKTLRCQLILSKSLVP